MYTLLAGSPPFWHRKQMLMLRMIMSGNYQFGSPEWDDYSDTVKDLVRGQARWLMGSGQGQFTAWGEGSVPGTGWRGLPGDSMASEGLAENLPCCFHYPPHSLRFPASWW